MSHLFLYVWDWRRRWAIWVFLNVCVLVVIRMATLGGIFRGVLNDVDATSPKAWNDTVYEVIHDRAHGSLKSIVRPIITWWSYWSSIAKNEQSSELCRIRQKPSQPSISSKNSHEFWLCPLAPISLENDPRVILGILSMIYGTDPSKSLINCEQVFKGNAYFILIGVGRRILIFIHEWNSQKEIIIGIWGSKQRAEVLALFNGPNWEHILYGWSF